MGFKNWWPELYTMSKFAKKRHSRAWNDTKKTIGWKQHKALLPAVFIVGFLLDLFLRGWVAVQEELRIAFIYGFSAVGVVSSFVYIYSWIAAPSRMLTDCETEISKISSHKPTQDALDQLSELKSEGIHQILNSPINSDEERGALLEFSNNWTSRVIAHMDSEFSRTDALYVRDLGSLNAVSFSQANSRKHNNILMNFSERENRINDLIKRGVD